MTEDLEAVQTELVWYQQRVADWMDSLFGDELASSPVERSMRFLEEALELSQARGMTEAEALRVVRYVFSRPVGDAPQEVGGVMVTLAGLCHKAGISMGAEAVREMVRIDAPAVRRKIFEKQAAKRAAGMTSDASWSNDRPETEHFTIGVELEAEHQRRRWGSDHDAGKTAFDWFWLVGYLAQKAATAAVDDDAIKARHHTISTAAALLNWHRALAGIDNMMRPGIDAVAQGYSE